MDMPWGSVPSGKFVTNVGLITSTGSLGDNIMAAEWTHHISYKPAMIAVALHTNDTTAKNILETGEFGVNLAAQDQNVVSSVAGGSHGEEVDKIAVLKELGYEFYKGKVPMLKGAALSVECKLIFHKELGDHILFIGEALDVKVSEKEPLVYHGTKYWKFGDRIEKPDQPVLDRIKALVEKHRKPINIKA